MCPPQTFPVRQAEDWQWEETSCTRWGGTELAGPPASASRVPGRQALTTVVSYIFNSLKPAYGLGIYLHGRSLTWHEQAPPHSTANTWKLCAGEIVPNSEALLHVTSMALGTLSLQMGCLLVAVPRSLLIFSLLYPHLVSVVYNHVMSWVQRRHQPHPELPARRSSR